MYLQYRSGSLFFVNLYFLLLLRLNLCCTPTHSNIRYPTQTSTAPRRPDERRPRGVRRGHPAKEAHPQPHRVPHGRAEALPLHPGADQPTRRRCRCYGRDDRGRQGPHPNQAVRYRLLHRDRPRREANVQAQAAPGERGHGGHRGDIPLRPIVDPELPVVFHGHPPSIHEGGEGQCSRRPRRCSQGWC